MGRVRVSDLSIAEKHLSSLFSLLDEEGNDVGDLIDRQQLDVATEVFCGESTNTLATKQQQFRIAMETLQKVGSLRQLLGKVGVWLDDKYLAPEAVKFIDDYQNTMTDKALSRSAYVTDSSSCLIDDLIRQGKSRKVINNAVISALTAGKDPTSTTLAFAFYEIAKRPDVFAKMKAEVEEQ